MLPFFFTLKLYYWWYTFYIWITTARFIFRTHTWVTRTSFTKTNRVTASSDNKFCHCCSSMSSLFYILTLFNSLRHNDGRLPSHPHGFFGEHLHGSQVQFSQLHSGLSQTMIHKLSLISPFPISPPILHTTGWLIV